MNKIKHLYTVFEKTVSNVKFAVIIITLFALALVLGTFMESYHGTDFAGRLVYKSWWFITLEVAMFLSILMATIVRLPPKKRLYGFYCIHAGLLILFIGSFFTYINGVDGSLQLLPNAPARKVIINEDLLKITLPKQNKMYKLGLPYSAFSSYIGKEIEGIKVKDFLPFAENKLAWESHGNDKKNEHSSQYQLFNDNMSQDFTLTLSPSSDFRSTMKMGLLNLHYMPALLKDCFVKTSESNLIIWNLMTSDCFTPEERKISVEKTDKGTRFLVVKFGNEFLKFFPDFSPVAVKDDLTKHEGSPFRVLSKSLFTDKPHLFLFGENITFYNKRRDKWRTESLASGKIAKLPWMGFKIRLINHREDAYPIEIPTYTRPIQSNNEVIKGGIKAIKIEFKGKDYWVRSDGPLELSNGKESVRFQIVNKEVVLPYQITLQRFKMNVNPGTNNPASYESFVQLLDGRTSNGLSDHHVFMNNPLKYDDFTFYQSSYFPMGRNDKNEEVYGSVFSVNYDPGRPFKYFGSLLLVLGSMWHYIINRKKIHRKKA